MSDKYLSINGKLMTIDNKLIKLPSGCIDPLSENLVDTNTELVNQNKALVEDIKTLVGGISIDPTLQEKTVTPTTEQQVVTPDAGNDGLSKVTVNAVTSSIDSNITPENIKQGVSILGITGTYEGDTSNINTVKKLLDATTQTQYMFQSYHGVPISSLIKYSDTSKVTNMKYMFNNCQDEIPLLDSSHVTNMEGTFRAIHAGTIPLFNTSNVTDMTAIFQQSQVSVIPALDMSKVTYLRSAFDGCSYLREMHATGMKVSFNISSSTKFTREALVEIINNCATVTSTQTLTMGSTNLAKLTKEDQQIATNKGWTLK